ncbi:dihydropseudooxynicotine hydrolase [Diaporthe amygdali]|uniref:dihydropseudooxynicotine hydrolase n=1 Tax=Phomopsis amygdali TaxID=1214568 RepID=UPI0022FE2675|nr:dihydropseudooxynicotine hydrolase [Diaporthe amygdali]KAJ0124365.1 dihydropseudooxynicotine hydrolase [Diaporthe amygdali]
MYKFLPSEFCNFEFLRVLGTAPTHGCDVGECVDVAANIKINDGESWYRAWSEAASKAEAAAEDCIRDGDRVGSRWALLRASNYRRSSELMLRKPVPSEDPRRLEAISQSAALFRKATALFDSPVEFLEIPFLDEGATLPAYLFLPPRGPDGDDSGKIPVVVQVQGFDTIQEEFYHFTVAGGLPRGYAVLTFDAPGQGMVLRRKEHRLHLRGDFEVVIKAVLDKLWSHAASSPVCKDLDLNRVAVSGNSMGAYFALRAAAFEPTRIKACIASDSFYDLGQVARDTIPGFFRYLNRGVVDSIMGLAVRLSPFQVRWELGHGILAFGAPTISDAVDKMAPFTLQKPDGTSICGDIACPTLVTDAPDTVFPLDAQRVYDNLTQLKDGQNKVMWRPVGVGQGSLQAKVAAFSHLHAKTFNWLDTVFEITRPSLEDAASK